mgnify:FL=1
MDWAKDGGINIGSVQELDEYLCDYMVFLFEEGVGRARAVDTVYGMVALFPAWRTSLPAALMSIKGWTRLAPSISHPPLTWDLTVLLATALVRSGQQDLACGCLLAFDCLLRITELLNLCNDDVACPGDLRWKSTLPGVCLRLKHTKTGKQQWVPVKNAFVTSWLLSIMSKRSSNAKIFMLESSAARSAFRSAVIEVGLPAAIVPHSLRHGGATALHLAGMSMEDILLRGRWSSVKSARTYIQVGKALLLDLPVSNHTLRSARELAGDLPSTFAQLGLKF